jgi:dephospho-CoA kinase
MFTVGLTGGIGSGKSTVADCFAALGVPVIDTDVIARDLTAPGGAALEEIHAVFGETVMQADGTLDRAALRRRVFADGAARRQLEAILHPRIRQVVVDMLATLTAPYALIVIPLLVQRQDRPKGERLAAYPSRVEAGGYRDMLNRVLVVDCPEDVQIVRVRARSGLAYDEIKAILAAQAGRAERLAVADDIIVNTATPEALRAEVAALHQRYLALAVAPPP